jgi:phage gp46-like protein
VAVRVVSPGGEARVISAGGEERVTEADAPVVALSTATLPRRTFRDVLLEVSEDGADLVLQGGDLAGENGLLTAVMISLFTDARALERDPLPVEETSRRGWWADEAPDRIGSLLWLLRREKVTRATVELARQYARASLQWMVEDGIAEQVDVEAAVRQPFTVLLTVRLQRGRARRWSDLWKATEGAMEASAKGLEVRVLTA